MAKKKATHPTALTPEEIASVSVPERTVEQDIDALLETPEAKKIALTILPTISDRIRHSLEASNAKVIGDKVTELIADNAAYMEAEREKLIASFKPLENDELERLANQEYIEFTVKVKPRTGNNREERTFVITELTQDVEEKLLRIITKNIGPIIQEVSSEDWKLQKSMLDKIQSVMAQAPTALSLLRECCAICLNPYGDEEDVDEQWVRNNLSSYRIATIIEMQAVAGKFRDFMSVAYRAIPQK